MNLLTQTSIAVATISAVIVPPAFSQENATEPQSSSLSIGIGFPDTSEPLRARAGIGFGVLPDYEGSSDYNAVAFPLVDVKKQGIFFVNGASINPNNGLASAGMTIFHLTHTNGNSQSTQFLLGPFIRAHQGREQDDNEILKGLGDIDPSVGVGIFMTLNTGPLLFNLTAAPHDVGNDNDGFLVSLDAAYTIAVNNNFELSSNLSTSWADDEYMQSYFGISNAQATNTGLSQFNSTSGFKDVGISFKATYALSKNWIIDGQLGYWHLLDDASNSPIVEKEGSENQVRGLVGLSYQF